MSHLSDYGAAKPAWIRLLPAVLAALLAAATWTPAEDSSIDAARAPVVGGAGIHGEQIQPPVPPQSSQPPQAVQSAPAVAPSVLVHTPDVLIEPSAESATAPLAAIAARDDVDYVAGAVRFDAQLVRPGAAADHEAAVAPDEPLTALAVDPTSFRPLAPEVTAQAAAVWQQLLNGDAVMTHEAALQRGVRLGDTVTLEGDHGAAEFRVGALAANGAPPLADVLVPVTSVDTLTDKGWNLLIVAASEGTGSVWLGEQIVSAIGGGSFERLDEPAATRGVGWGQLETFQYEDLDGGRIRILGDWVERFIVTVDLPIVGRTQCNRLMVPQLVAALNEIAEAGLAALIDPAQFGGCWVPRHIDWNPAKSISMHAWGLAIDLNVVGNGLGRTPTMDMRIVEIFQRWGFYWGGWWDRPDGMHFQVNQFVAP